MCLRFFTQLPLYNLINWTQSNTLTPSGMDPGVWRSSCNVTPLQMQLLHCCFNADGPLFVWDIRPHPNWITYWSIYGNWTSLSKIKYGEARLSAKVRGEPGSTPDKNMSKAPKCTRNPAETERSNLIFYFSFETENGWHLHFHSKTATPQIG